MKENLIDVFCSYQTESLSHVEKIVAILEGYGVKCWYAARDCRENHAREIIAMIKQCKVFLLFEDSNVATEPRGDILNEVNMACTLYNRGKIKIIRLKLTDNDLESADLVYYVGRIQHTNFFNRSMQESTQELLFKISDIIGKNLLNIAHDSTKEVREKNTYFQSSDTKEIERLKVQQQLLKTFDKDIYDKLVTGKKDLVVLDIGSNDGTLVMERLGSRSEVQKIIAIEIDEDTVKKANEQYKDQNIEFYSLDIENKDFLEELYLIMDKNSIEAFDFINISMVLLHVENPERLLWKLRKVLKNNGDIFIRDIDDGFNVAYPDPQDVFKKTMEICANSKESGYRKSGREIYSLLHKSKYTNIKFEKQGITTVGMSMEEKEAFFNTYFSFIIIDAKTHMLNNPADVKVKKEYNWLEDNYDELEEAFYQNDFFFNLGFVIFTAKK